MEAEEERESKKAKRGGRSKLEIRSWKMMKRSLKLCQLDTNEQTQDRGRLPRGGRVDTQESRCGTWRRYVRGVAGASGSCIAHVYARA